MKEVTFIRQNIEKWKRAETMVEQAESLSPDELADAYTELTADLAFAQTHFPASRITIYLNNLASALHNRIYRNKREKWSRIITYWTREVPSAMHDARRELVASFIIFVVSALIGVVSAAGDPDFVRLILGNSFRVPGHEPYKAYAPIPLVPELDPERCERCGRCALVCPVQTIDPGNYRVTDPSRCIACFACVRYCRAGARSLAEPARSAFERKMEALREACQARREPETFL